jgi:hypothetical protein
MGLFSVTEGRLLCRLPSNLSKSVRHSAVKLAAISADGRTLVALHNSGAANGKAAVRAGNLTLVDIATGKSRGTGVLPYLHAAVRSADATRAFAVHATLDDQPGGEPTLSAIDLGRAEIVWRAALPRKPRGAHVWSDGVVIFGPTWVGVWKGARAESLLGPTSVLQDLPAHERPTRIEDAYVIDAPARLFVVYVSKASGAGMAEVAISSGNTVRTVRVPSGFRFLSDDGAALLAWSREGRVLWDGVTLRPMGPLLGQQDVVSRVSFDASGHRVATAAVYGPLDRIHVVIWDVRTQRAIGQCLLDDATGAVQLLADGDAILTSGREGMVLCEASAGGR